MMRTDFLLQCQCWFAGGTAIVVKNGEYSLSLDVDFRVGLNWVAALRSR